MAKPPVRTFGVSLYIKADPKLRTGGLARATPCYTMVTARGSTSNNTVRDVLAPRGFQSFYSLREAEQCIPPNDTTYRVWASDRTRKDGTIGKYFVVGSVPDFYNYMMQEQREKFQWYEVISRDFPARFFMDVEIHQTTVDPTSATQEQVRKRLLYIGAESEVDAVQDHWLEVSKRPWSEKECEDVDGYVRGCLCAFLQQRDPDKVPVVKALSGCRETKFSMHYVVPGMYECDGACAYALASDASF